MEEIGGTFKVLKSKSTRKIPPGRSRSRWEDNIISKINVSI
jgi:hypothetical protein